MIVRHDPSQIENEEADQLAKAGAELPADPQKQPTLAGVSRLRKAKTGDQHNDWWQAQLPKVRRYREIGLTTASLARPEELDLPRSVLHNLLAARSGHGTLTGTTASSTIKMAIARDA